MTVLVLPKFWIDGEWRSLTDADPPIYAILSQPVEGVVWFDPYGELLAEAMRTNTDVSQALWALYSVPYQANFYPLSLIQSTFPSTMRTLTLDDLMVGGAGATVLQWAQAACRHRLFGG